MKYNIKSGSEVVVISGSHKGSRGKILQVQKNKNRVIVEGIAMRKKHVKKSQDNPEGAIQEREGSIHYSNVMLAERYDSRKKSKK